MKHVFYSILAIVVVVVGAVAIALQTAPAQATTFGPNYATTTSYIWSTEAIGHKVKTGSGVLSSIVIGNATAVGTITVYDATTTVNGSLYGTTTLAVINTGTPGGSYVYDVAFTKGLLVVSSVGLATSTITFQ